MTGKKRRRAVALSDVDRDLIARGKTPGYKEGASEPRLVGETQEPPNNDARILAEIPPHAVTADR